MSLGILLEKLTLQDREVLAVVRAEAVVAEAVVGAGVLSEGTAEVTEMAEIDNLGRGKSTRPRLSTSLVKKMF